MHFFADERRCAPISGIRNVRLQHSVLVRRWQSFFRQHQQGYREVCNIVKRLKVRVLFTAVMHLQLNLTRNHPAGVERSLRLAVKRAGGKLCCIHETLAARLRRVNLRTLRNRLLKICGDAFTG